MNKFTITLALFSALVAFVGVVSANLKHKHHHKQIHDDNDDDFEIGHHRHGGHGGHGGHFHGSPLSHFSDEHLFEELRLRGHHGGHGGFGHGGHGGQGGGFGHKHGKRHHGKHFGEHGGHGGHGIRGGFGGIGASHSKHGGISKHNRLGSHGSIENGSSGLIGGEKHLEVGLRDSDRSENEGISKHQTFAKDKTIVQDRVHGTNDVDGFRTSHGNTDEKNFKIGSSGIAAGEKHGRIEGGKEIESDFSANGGSSSSINGVGAGFEI